MEIICLDLEGVIIPEIWINVAKKTGIESLRATTRDIPDYDELMRTEILQFPLNQLSKNIEFEIIRVVPNAISICIVPFGGIVRE